MPKIVISYRRADSQDIAMRIRDKLSARYGKRAVFTDIDSIPIGRDFLRHITTELSTSDVLLAVVGPRWTRGGSEQGQGIEEETDYVRIEVEGALKRDIPVIPVLVGGARMPKPSELPEALRAFAYRNAATVDSGVNFQNDMDRLIRSLDEEFASRSREQSPSDGEPSSDTERTEADVAGKDGDRPAYRPSPLSRAIEAFTAARHSVPVVGFAVGAAGVAALAALAIVPFGHARAAGVIFAGMLVALFLVLLFARLLRSRNSAMALAGLVTVWAVALFFITFLVFTATAVAFKWPAQWASLIGFGSEAPPPPSGGVLAICARPDEESVSYSCGYPEGDHVAINIRLDDSDRGLVIRSHADISGIQVGLIPPNGTDILAGACENDWCPVQCKDEKGWSRKRYLSPRQAALRPVKGINPNDPQGLGVRTGPHPTCRAVGTLRSNGREVILHGCEAIDGSTWCRITFNRFSGWIPSENLELQR
jgi:SH3-like domain-containing protein